MRETLIFFFITIVEVLKNFYEGGPWALRYGYLKILFNLNNCPGIYFYWTVSPQSPRFYNKRAQLNYNQISGARYTFTRSGRRRVVKFYRRTNTYGWAAGREIKNLISLARSVLHACTCMRHLILYLSAGYARMTNLPERACLFARHRKRPSPREPAAVGGVYILSLKNIASSCLLPFFSHWRDWWRGIFLNGAVSSEERIASNGKEYG